MPARWMWALDDELNDHFERVKEERREKYLSGKDGGDEDGGLMMANEYAKGRGGDVRQ